VKKSLVSLCSSRMDGNDMLTEGESKRESKKNVWHDNVDKFDKFQICCGILRGGVHCMMMSPRERVGAFTVILTPVGCYCIAIRFSNIPKVHVGS